MTINLDPATVDDELITVAIGDIKTNPRNRTVGDVTDLAASIKTVGVIQPLTITGGPDDEQWFLVAGHRRLAAAKKAKLTEVPCIVRAGLTDADIVELSVVENLHRVDLTPTEEAESYAQLIEIGWDQKRIGERFKRSQPHVSKRLGLLELPVAARRAVDSGGIHLDLAAQLVRLKKVDEKAFDKLTGHGYGAQISEYQVHDRIETAARAAKVDKIAKPLVAKGLRQLRSVQYNHWEKTTAKDASAFSVNEWYGTVEYYKPKTADASANGTATTAPVVPPSLPKETAAEKRKRAAREKREAARLTAITTVARNPHNAPWTLIAVWMWDLVENDISVDDVTALLAVLGLEPPIHEEGAPAWDIDWDDTKDRIDAYLCTDTDHAREFAVACAAVVSTWGDRAVAEGLRFCAIAGYELDKTEREKVDRWLLDQRDARDRGYKIIEPAHCRICGCTEDNACEDGCHWVPDPALKGDLCSQCVDKVDTVHDPDSPTTTRETIEAIRERGHAFAEANALEPGDVVDENGVTRAADVDDDFERALKAGIDAPVAKLVR